MGYLHAESLQARGCRLKGVVDVDTDKARETCGRLGGERFSTDYRDELTEEGVDLINIPGFNEYVIKEHSWTLVAVAGTNYFNGFFAPRVVAAFVYPNSGFVSFKAAFRIFEHWRAELAITDIFGEDPYKALGLFRDRDEINLRIRYQF